MKLRSPITTHVLDVSTGRPAEGLLVRLEYETPEWRQPLAEKATDQDGRVDDWLDPDYRLSPGTYRLTFFVGSWEFAVRDEGFWPEVTIAFRVTDPSQHYHVPLLLSPFGYSTYRGS